MRRKIHKGFVSLQSEKEGPLFIVPHSGLALDNPQGEIDQGTQSVAYHYLNTFGGSAILSLFSREKEIGIDFWRPVPKDAKKSKKYAWFYTSKNKHEEKKKIYKKFWDFIFSQRANTVIVLHRQLPRVKNHPSIIDIVSFGGKGFSREKMREVIEKMNKKYQDRFYWMRDEYRELMLIYIDYFFLRYKNKNIKSLLKKDFRNFRSSLGILTTKKLERNFSKTLFKEFIVELLQKQPNLRITLEKNFRGRLIGNVIDPLFDNRIVISFEINQLLSQYYPSFTSRVIHDIISEYRRI